MAIRYRRTQEQRDGICACVDSLCGCENGKANTHMRDAERTRDAVKGANRYSVSGKQAHVNGGARVVHATPSVGHSSET